jgi:hypothetical protein
MTAKLSQCGGVPLPGVTHAHSGTGFLRALPAEERRRLGRAGMTKAGMRHTHRVRANTTFDNYSTRGNVNPYTGQQGTRSYEDGLQHYNNSTIYSNRRGNRW